MTRQILSYRRWIPVFLVLIGMILSVVPASATIFSEDGSDRTISELYDLTNSTKPADINGSAMFFFRSGLWFLCSGS